MLGVVAGQWTRAQNLAGCFRSIRVRTEQCGACVAEGTGQQWLALPAPGPEHATRTICGGTYCDMSVRVACTTTVSVLILFN